MRIELRVSPLTSQCMLILFKKKKKTALKVESVFVFAADNCLQV